MSNLILTAVWQHSTSRGSTRLVLLSIADQANDDGEAWPSVGSIGRRCLLSGRSVQEHLDKLIESGELRRNERPGRSSVFTVTVGVRDSAPLKGVRDSAGVGGLTPSSWTQGGVMPLTGA